MFPIIGSFHGPGANLGEDLFVFDLFHVLFTIKMNKRKVKKAGKMLNCFRFSMIERERERGRVLETLHRERIREGEGQGFVVGGFLES